MQPANPLVSIICPAYQEECVLEAFHARLASSLSPLEGSCRFEILYVDDGSRDGTLSVMRKLAARDGRVRYLSLSRNFGKEAAMAAGLEHCRGDAAVTLDTDLQHPPEVIAELVQKWRGGNDIVLTERRQMEYPSLARRWAAGFFFAVMRRMQERPQSATDFQLLSRRAIDAVRRMPEPHRFLRGLVAWVGYPTATVPFTVAARAGGDSKFDLTRLAALAADGLLSSSRMPARLPLYAGMALLAITMLDLLAVATLWLAGVGIRWQLHALAGVVMATGGMVLCGLGIVGEYVGRIYEQGKARPLYLLKEQSPDPSAREKAA